MFLSILSKKNYLFLKHNEMNKFALLLLFSFSINTYSQIKFNDFFEAHTLRIDFNLTGHADLTQAYLSKLIEEPYWGGRQAHMDSSLRLGDFLIVVTDPQGQTIYEEGFATLFEEWQDTKEAQTISRSFPNTMIMPFPKKTCHISILQRKEGIFQDTLLQFVFDPKSPMLTQSTPPNFKIDTIKINAPTEHALDIVILAEGFQKQEMEEFRKLSQELSNTLCSSAVFKRNKKHINFYSIEAISQDSGADNPTKGEWKNTAFNASFNTLYSERYLMVHDVWSIRDAASLVPYDQIYIIINTEKYGGGGIYNFYSTCSAYGHSSKEVMIHEFGHGFAALADEYYYDDNMLIDYIDKTKEPWQKNITTLVDFDSKWADLLDKNTPIPTPKKEAKKYPIGVYEGAAYVSKGIYRASPDCRMKTNEAKDFCPVCERAIQEVIDFITK